MKSNKILQVILLIMIVIFLVVGGFLYYNISRDNKRPVELNASISRNQAIANKALADIATKQKEADTLASQLANAKSLLGKVNFQSSSESIEYDRIFYGIADAVKLQATMLNSSDATELKEGANTFKVATFTINVEPKTPETIFNTTADSAAYINAGITNILAYIDQLATMKDFTTTVIQSVNITASKPMTAQEITDKIKSIKDIIKAKLTEAEKSGLTDDQMTALVETKYAALSKDDIPRMLNLAGFDRPSAILIIEIWTYKKGA